MIDQLSSANQPPRFLSRFTRVTVVPGRLPHWETAGVATFVTLRLRDSLPSERLAVWQDELETWRREHKLPWSPEEEQEYKVRFLGRIEKWLDAGYGSCLLKSEANRQVVEDCLRHNAGRNYSLYAFVVMPNHLHALLMPRDGVALGKIVTDFKRYTGRVLGGAKSWSGPLWEDEYWDTSIRNVEHFNRVRAYIRSNCPALAFDAYAI